ncbi:hypothetical protein ABOM_002970 [Aspergillus bombycis]|uniref:Acyl carrier protein n=1 Tax=Aspergillus bombycis TaxID=109264 RepID=A0A1F8ABQ2_9EURO|nr:hypothetical protein ABOM_002970 [Aspergillus bombycis]OGM48788.1 hypothetical protein ABOM_002970 [Aspergillus bombycis]
MPTVEERVKAIVAEQLDYKPEEIKNDASIVDDLGADSLSTVELVLAIEGEFELDISDEAAEQLKTTQDIIDYVIKHRDE